MNHVGFWFGLIAVLCVATAGTAISLSKGQQEEQAGRVVSRVKRAELSDDELNNWEAPKDIRDLMPYYVSGTTNDGLTVFVLDYGKWDFTKMAALPKAKWGDYWKYFDQIIGRMVREAKRADDNGIYTLVDWDGFSLANYASPAALKLSLKHFAAVIKANGALNSGIYINTNFAAESFVNLARPFLGGILDRFEVFGTKREKWEPALIRRVPADQLPAKYGGTNKDWKPVHDSGKWT